MAKLSFRQEAIEDIDSIYRYTVHQWSIRQADKYYFLLKTACNELANGDKIGRSFADVLDGLLGYRVGKHIIFYTLEAEQMQVIRILHERMDYRSRF